MSILLHVVVKYFKAFDRFFFVCTAAVLVNPSVCRDIVLLYMCLCAFPNFLGCVDIARCYGVFALRRQAASRGDEERQDDSVAYGHPVDRNEKKCVEIFSISFWSNDRFRLVRADSFCPPHRLSEFSEFSTHAHTLTPRRCPSLYEVKTL